MIEEARSICPLNSFSSLLMIQNHKLKFFSTLLLSEQIFSEQIFSVRSQWKALFSSKVLNDLTTKTMCSFPWRDKLRLLPGAGVRE